MDKDTFLNAIKEIGTLEDDVERRTKLTELSDSLSNLFDENQTLTESNKKYAEDNEKLRTANMQLFLRVGENKPDETKAEYEEQEKEPRKFEDLFDDKGNLK